MSVTQASHRLGTTVGNAFNRSPRWSTGNYADITAESDDHVPKLRACVRTASIDSDVAHGATGRYLRRVSSEPDLFRARRWRHGDDTRSKPNGYSDRDHDHSGAQHGVPQELGLGKDSPPISNGVIEGPPEPSIKRRGRTTSF